VSSIFSLSGIVRTCARLAELPELTLVHLFYEVHKNGLDCSNGACVAAH
jgi:hypothetical protein